MAEGTPPGQDSASQVPLTLSDVLRRLEWRTELLTVAVILAEASLIWLVAGLLMAESETRAVYPFWIIAFILLTAHYVTHLLDQARVWSPDYEIILGGSLIITLLVAVKGASFPSYAIYDPGWVVEAANGLAFFDTEAVRSVWGSAILVFYSWWRGRSREQPSLDSAYTMLRWGTLALGAILILILAGAPAEAEIRDLLSTGTLGFFVFSLGAIGLARMQLEGFRAAGPLGPRWLATFATPILVIVGVAVVAAGIFSRRFLETVLWILAPVLFVLGVVFQIIVLILAIIAFLILTPIFWIIGDWEAAGPESATPAADESEGVIEQPLGESFVMPEALQYLIAAIVLVALISLLTRYLFRRRARGRQATTEQRESVMDWSEILGSLGGRLRSLFDRDPKLDPYAALRGDDRWRHTIRIRERYRTLQKRGQDLGRARQPRETAEEYRPVVASRLTADGRPAVDAMTMIYRRARYSGIPATDEEARRMEEHWKRAEDAPGHDPGGGE